MDEINFHLSLIVDITYSKKKNIIQIIHLKSAQQNSMSKLLNLKIKVILLYLIVVKSQGKVTDFSTFPQIFRSDKVQYYI